MAQKLDKIDSVEDKFQLLHAGALTDRTSDSCCPLEIMIHFVCASAFVKR